MTIVVDASVAVKWYLNERGSDAAALLLQGEQPLFAPALIRIEVAGAITRHFREGKLSEKRARQACQLWLEDLSAGVIKLLADETLFEAAQEMAFCLRHPLQDCLYLAVSEQLNGRLVTADEPLYKRARKQISSMEFLAGCQSN